MPKKAKQRKAVTCQQTQTDEILINTRTKKMELMSLNETVANVVQKAKRIKENFEFHESFLKGEKFSIDELKCVDNLQV